MKKSAQNSNRQSVQAISVQFMGRGLYIRTRAQRAVHKDQGPVFGIYTASGLVRFKSLLGSVRLATLLYSGFARHPCRKSTHVPSTGQHVQAPESGGAPSSRAHPQESESLACRPHITASDYVAHNLSDLLLKINHLPTHK